MSDHPTDPHDDVLRAALQAEADDVTAGADLLDRIHAAERGSSGWTRRTPWLLTAAVAAVIIGIAATLAVRGDDQTVDIVDDPSGPTTTSIDPNPGSMFDRLSAAFPCQDGYQTVFYLAPTASAAEADAVRAALQTAPQVRSVRFVPTAEVAAALEAAAPEAEWDPASIPSAYLATSATEEDDLAARGAASDLAGVTATSSSDCTNPPPGPTDDRPTLVALVREDGMLVTVDLTTGEERELFSYGDPRAEVEEGGPYFIDAVDLSPDGQWIYFSTCCEPASGSTLRIPVAGGEPEVIAVGAYPRVSPDGRFVATGGADGFLLVTPADGQGAAATVALECCFSRLAWSPDGTQLAAVNGTGGEGDEPQGLLFDWDGTALTPADTGKPDNPTDFVSWGPDGTFTTTSGDAVADDRALSQDASYEWLLWVDQDGVVLQQDGFTSGDRTPIDGLPASIAADW